MDGKRLEYKGEEALKELERVTANAGEIQESMLEEILKKNGKSEYLSKYMEGSTGVSEYKARVPVVTYAAIRPYIQRIANGGEDSSIISGYPIREMLISSGTSGGKPKLMPSIEQDLDRRTYLYNMIMPIMNQYIQGLDQGKAMNLLFIKSEMPTPSGLPARPVLTSYYKSPHFRNRSPDRFNDHTSPDEAILCRDIHQSMYCQLLAGLLHRHSVLRISAVFASALLRAISFLERHWLELCHDIRSGCLSSSITDAACREAMSAMLSSPNPALADDINGTCGGSWKGVLCRLWPKARCIEAVLTGSMAQYIPALEYYSDGKIPLVCTMYASSECYFGVNLRPLCDPAEVSYTLLPNMAYFEFMPLEDGLGSENFEEEETRDVELAALVDVKLGCYYELVVTTFAGLYRYRVGDVLQVTGFHNQAPQFRFICRKNVVLSIDSDKTNEKDLQRSISASKKLLEAFNFLLVEYTSYADTLTVPGHYVLFWEIVSTADDCSNGSNKEEGDPSLKTELLQECCVAIEESLDYNYRRCRSHDRSVGPLEIRVVRVGAFEALMDFLINQGGSINQYKTPRCLESDGAIELLSSMVKASFFSPRDPTWNP